MSTTVPLPEPQDVRDAMRALAAEYVLGTLSAESRCRVEQRMEREPALRAAVEGWEARLLPLVALVPPVETSPGVWARIAQSVDRIGAAPEPTPRREGAARPAAGPGWWRSLPVWRGLSGAGFATAAVLAALLVRQLQAPVPMPEYMVVLVAPQGQSAGWVVQAGARRQLDLIPLADTAVPTEKTLQFWTKADGWNRPRSLGLVEPGHAVRIPLDRLPPLQPDQLFELTLEPAGGSPLDRPTGPIRFSGRAVKVTT
ncbi:anti-sigma factor [Xylophilus ampelinus]|nr:anti-sigma factor [Xylophilus ampelinus]MCS4510259.1 anti-sigma factor [Xylophilus ampelinus]